MSEYRIGIWGQYGDGGKIADGQAVRTTIITKELQLRYGEENVKVVNTNKWRKHPLKFLCNCFMLVATSKIVVVAPADNGYRVFVPLLVFLNFFFRRKLIHIVIGGFLPTLLKETPMYLKMENKFDAIFVQTNNILKDMEAVGVKNISILSNPKRLKTRKQEDIFVVQEKVLKLCVFSRIYKDKGVEDAIEAVKICNKTLGGKFFTLDFYGLLPEEYRERFTDLLKENQDILQYKGIVDFDKTVEVLKNYFVMLFPTFYHGEGFPGNVIDAYNTGLPIIATDWLYNSDVVLDGITGLLVPIKNPQALAEAILKLYNDRQLHYSLAINSLKESKKYSPGAVLATLYNFIDKQ